jgi:lysozyme family protein
MAASAQLTTRLETEYQQLFDSCHIREERANFVDGLVKKIDQNRTRYQNVGDQLGIPWYFVGAIHNMESSLNFKSHLHNGDPLTERTVQVPTGRPKVGEPPFSWEDSAMDALQLQHLDRWQDWSIPGTLYKLEAYNGFGYRLRHPEVLSPYLWSFSTHYTQGKFVSDGTFSANAVSQQCGAATILRRMSEIGTIQFKTDGTPIFATGGEGSESLVAAFRPLVRFSKKGVSPQVATLQRTLNTFAGIFLKVDGIPGPRTSDAFKKVTGHFLFGDPRGNS